MKHYTPLILCGALIVQTLLLIYARHDRDQWKQAAYNWGNAFTNMEKVTIDSQRLAKESQEMLHRAGVVP